VSSEYSPNVSHYEVPTIPTNQPALNIPCLVPHSSAMKRTLRRSTSFTVSSTEIVYVGRFIHIFGFEHVARLTPCSCSRYLRISTVIVDIVNLHHMSSTPSMLHYSVVLPDLTTSACPAHVLHGPMVCTRPIPTTITVGVGWIALLRCAAFDATEMARG
jgi:hypothetical protein